MDYVVILAMLYKRIILLLLVLGPLLRECWLNLISPRYPNSIWLGTKKIGHVQKVVINDFHALCDHYKTLVHSKHKCYHQNPNLRKISSNKPKNVEAIQDVCVINEVVIF